MSSLDRLIELAKKTGDRLIVHNPYDNQDVVIMTVDEYEGLALSKKDVRGLSSSEMLDQINRDIANWRVNKELDEKWENEMFLEDELKKQEPFDPFADVDSHTPDWHTAGSILENRYGELNLEDFEEEKDDEIKINDLPDLGMEKTQAVPFVEQTTEVWKDEPLSDDEPVFYEEPV